MVKDPRKKAGPGPVRALNRPEPVAVAEDEYGAPARLVLRGRKLSVAAVQDTWEIEDEWWRPQPIARRYYRVALTDGPTITIFRDLTGGAWYRQDDGERARD